MKRKMLFIGVVFFFLFAGWAVRYRFYLPEKEATPADFPPSAPDTSQSGNPAAYDDTPQRTVIASDLDTPWAIAFLPNTGMLVTERSGSVLRIDPTGKAIHVANITKAKEAGEGGLLGVTLHPDFLTNNFVYLYYTYKNSGSDTLNRVVRMTYSNNQLSDEMILVDKIPGALNHNGGRIRFGPDQMLYITTGDAQEPSQAQNKNSLAGKILRVTDTGQPAPGNPFGNAVYSFGHRNPQGIAWDSAGRLWSTEHGRSGIQSGLDEINMIEPGKNYGWPEIQGGEKQEGMENPKLHSGSSTWAPAGAAFIGPSLFFAGLRGQTLYETVVSNDQTNPHQHFNGEYGRIREVITGPDDMLYITTSNRDGRGIPASDDDRIIRIHPQKLR